MNAQVHARLRGWIAASGLGEGARLPAERALCAMLGVSRAEIRKALLVLELEGQLQRTVGRGTFLLKPPEARRTVGAAVSIADLADRTGPHEAMMARLALEPELAGMAALNAAPRQIRELRGLSDAMRRAATWREYEALDAEFHNVIAEAAGNSLLHEVHRIVNGVRLVVVWRRLDTPEIGPPPDYHSFGEHDAIVAAIESRASAEARAAMLTHLRVTLATIASTP